MVNRRRKKQKEQAMASVADDPNDGSTQNLSKLHGKAKIENLVEDDFGLDNYYSPLMPWRIKELLSSFYMHLCALEHNMTLYDRQQTVLDDLLNLVKKQDEEDY
eukprot:jgi/Hompol1/359/HPOL_001092-RA